MEAGRSPGAGGGHLARCLLLKSDELFSRSLSSPPLLSRGPEPGHVPPLGESGVEGTACLIPGSNSRVKAWTQEGHGGSASRVHLETIAAQLRFTEASVMRKLEPINFIFLPLSVFTVLQRRNLHTVRFTHFKCTT